MSPEDERRRPAGNGPASRSLDSNRSVNATADFFAQVAECSDPERPLFRAAVLQAEAWEPALNRSYRFGYENGYAAGFYEAEQHAAAAWAKAAQPIRDVLAMPPRAELDERRGGGA